MTRNGAYFRLHEAQQQNIDSSPREPDWEDETEQSIA
jgi:hypothetical protein